MSDDGQAGAPSVGELPHDQLLRAFAQLPAVFALMVGPEHRFVFANTRFRAELGLGDITGRPAREVFPELVDGPFFLALETVYQYAHSITVPAAPVPRLWPNGAHETRWYSAYFEPLRGAGGRIEGVMALGLDVTEKKGGEEALAQARRLRDLIVATMTDGVVAIDRGGRVLFANEAQARLTGFASAAELTGAAREEVLARWEVRDADGALLARDEWPLSRALAGQAVEGVVVRMRDARSREDRWVLMSATPVKGSAGEVELVVAVCRDFTEQQRREEAQRFLAEASAVLGSSLDYEATLRTMARLAVPRLADWCAVEMKTADGGSEQLAVAHVDPAKIEYARELARRWPPDRSAPNGVPQVLRSGRPELYPEIPEELLLAGARDDEHRRVILALGLKSALVVPINSTRGTVGAITLVFAESGRRYRDADLALAEQLAARAALAIDNATLYSEAQRAVRLRDDFLSIAGHELRTPLTALQLQVQGVMRRLEQDIPPSLDAVHERLLRASSHITRLERLINELLDVSRISTGRLTVQREPMDLTTLAREVIERFNDDAARPRAPVELHTPGPLIGRWDRLRLDQVLTNLVSNGVKYGDGKPVTVELSGSDGVRIVVRDRGIGISPADQKRIFERFERAVSERNYGGLGLGLWIVRQIVEAHGGSIALESARDVGTTFTVHLPR